MFKWKRSSTDSSPVLSPPDSVPSTATTFADADTIAAPDDEALDAFAGVLRALGQYAFDLENESSITFSQQCESWARHLLILAPPPTEDASQPNGDVPRSGETRDWATVLRFVQSRRQREQQHVNKALGDLRAAHGAHTIGITISVGVSQLGRHESVQSWLERTDRALYQAKSQGRDRVIAASEAD